VPDYGNVETETRPVVGYPVQVIKREIGSFDQETESGADNLVTRNDFVREIMPDVLGHFSQKITFSLGT
jgi:hypothetical protein